METITYFHSAVFCKLFKLQGFLLNYKAIIHQCFGSMELVEMFISLNNLYYLVQSDKISHSVLRSEAKYQNKYRKSYYCVNSVMFRYPHPKSDMCFTIKYLVKILCTRLQKLNRISHAVFDNRPSYIRTIYKRRPNGQI